MQANQPISAQKRKELRIEAVRLVWKTKRQFGDGACPPEVLNRLKEIFQELRPLIPKDLAIYLIEQQTNHLLGERLFKEPEMNLAVWAHARAHGWTSRTYHPETTNGDYSKELPESLRSHASLISPLFPPPLDWGATSHLQDKVVASLDSPIIHAWLYKDENGTITEAVIVGRGIPEIRTEVTAAALSSFFALKPKVDDFALTGVIRLAAVEPEETDEKSSKGFLRNLNLLLPFKQGETKSEITIPQTAAEAMLLLQGALQRLQDETGFVQVHFVKATQAKAFRRKLSEYNKRASRSDTAYYWYAEANQGDSKLNELDIVTTMPFTMFPQLERGVLMLELADDLINNQLYQDLAEKYHQALVNDILEDTQRREHFYAKLLEDHQNERNWYQNLSDKEKQELDDVKLTYKINYELALQIRLAKPRKVSAREYYVVIMEHLIDEDTRWLNMMRRLHQQIERILEDEIAPLARLIGARLFDAVLRDVKPSDEPVVLTRFQDWKRLVQPMLWLEWRHLLELEHIRAADICTRHTIFNLALNQQDKSLALAPHSILDACCSVVLFDPSRRIQVIYDAIDYAEQKTFRPDSDASKADELYRIAKQLAEQGNSVEQIRKEVWAAIRANPRSITQRIVDEWLNTLPDQEEEFNNLRTGGIQKVFPSNAALSALEWCNESCFHSADDVLKRAERIIQDTEQPNVAVDLMRAYLECILNGHSRKALLDILKGQKPPFELEHIASRIRQANLFNPELVTHFLEEGRLAPSSFPQPHAPVPSPDEEGAIAVHTAIEATNLAIHLAKAITSLDANYESRRSAYAKLVPAIEQCYALEFASPPAGLKELLTLLVGEE